MHLILWKSVYVQSLKNIESHQYCQGTDTIAWRTSGVLSMLIKDDKASLLYKIRLSIGTRCIR
jgi:hypothetical protein